MLRFNSTQQLGFSPYPFCTCMGKSSWQEGAAGRWAGAIQNWTTVLFFVVWLFFYSYPRKERNVTVVLDVVSTLQFLCHPLCQNLSLHFNARKPSLHYHEFSDGFLSPWESKPLINDKLI